MTIRLLALAFPLSCLLACLLACAAPPDGGSAGPGAAPGASVLGVRERGPYLDVVVQDGDETQRRFVPVSPDCRFVLTAEARVAFHSSGLAGRFERSGVLCTAVGIGDPLMSRSNRGRGGMGELIPRGQANFRELYRDDDVILLRGRFPLVERVGFTGGDDCVAVVRNEPACRDAAEEGVASIEFRARGKNTLALVAGRELCRIDLLALPPAP
ncbi:MAG: hypothetical protein QNK05_25495 [Myxococcota bacterium]|nr:hypothetical protein [Myxococcota bacterium]